MRRRGVNIGAMGRARSKSRARAEGGGSVAAMPVEAFVKRCTAVLDLLEELPERAQDFVMSCTERLQDMQNWAEEHGHVTARMLETVGNIQSGAERWLH